MTGTTNLRQDNGTQTPNWEQRFNRWYIFLAVVWEVLMLASVIEIIETGGYVSFVVLAIGLPSAVYAAAIAALQWIARGFK